MAAVVALGGVIGCGADQPGAVGEASANFDMEDVEPVLRRISTLIESGFSAEDAKSLAAKISAQELESEHEYRYRVRIDGTSADLRVVAFMDDVDAPDLAFFTQPALARSIQTAIGAYMTASGK